MPDPLNTDPNPVPAPGPARTTCVCEFCGCQLAPSGEIIRMGDVAKQYRTQEDTVARKDKEIAQLTEQLAESRKKVAELEALVPKEERPMGTSSKWK